MISGMKIESSFDLTNAYDEHFTYCVLLLKTCLEPVLTAVLYYNVTLCCGIVVVYCYTVGLCSGTVSTLCVINTLSK
jgi:hypothetical protein